MIVRNSKIINFDYEKTQKWNHANAISQQNRPAENTTLRPNLFCPFLEFQLTKT